MGTETVQIQTRFVGLCVQVKLNNPLMGTETYFTFLFFVYFCIQKVKLKNPLMGTETNHDSSHFRF